MGYAQPIDMYEIFNRLRSNPNLFAKIIVASFFVNLLALATPIYVIQVLQRYVAYGVTSTLYHVGCRHNICQFLNFSLEIFDTNGRVKLSL